jgi:uncharacterized protein
MRLLVFLLGLFLLYLVLKAYFRNLATPRQPDSARLPEQGEDMVRCVVCGVNTPRSEAILSGGDFFCSEEHRRLRRH